MNLVSAGPLATLAASGIPGFEQIGDAWGLQAPLGWDTADPTPVADTVCFLLSDLARAMSGPDPPRRRRLPRDRRAGRGGLTPGGARSTVGWFGLGWMAMALR